MLFLACLIISDLSAADGDTLKLRTIEFTQRREGWFNFPASDKKFQRILMNFKLRCPPGKICGRWDYIADVAVLKFYAVNFKLNGGFPNQASFMFDTSWNYKMEINGTEKNIVKTPKNAMKLYYYKDPSKPAVPTDSMNVWPTYYDNYKFDDTGIATDSTLVVADTTVTKSRVAVYFNNENTDNDKIEIMRYITPYGSELNLGEGVTWLIDVTDFLPLLQDKIYINSNRGGWGDVYSNQDQEDLELTFDFIEGTPPRDIVNFKTMWTLNGVQYNEFFDNYLAPIDYNFSSNEKTAILKVIQSGHGFGGTVDNCAEFCKKKAYVKVDGIQRYDKWIWKTCGDNPIYPQNGTWIHDRSNWCPGREVPYHNYELTNYIKAGKHTIDYDMEAYKLVITDSSSTPPNWVISSFLITYGEPNFSNDARIIEITAPNKDRLFNRLNPICGKPQIVIQNTGKDSIFEITLKYGNDLNNLIEEKIKLSNPLFFMESANISLSSIKWLNPDKPGVFYVFIEKVNGKDDEYKANNKAISYFDLNVDELPNNFAIELITNNSEILGIGSPYSYVVYDLDSNVVYEKTSTLNNSTYSDTLNLKDDCYQFIISNPEGYGLGFRYFEGLKNGSLRFIKDYTELKYFQPDFGNYSLYNFRTTSFPALKTDFTDTKIDFGTVKIGEKVSRFLKIFPENVKGLKIIDMKIPLGTSKKFSIKKVVSTNVGDPLNLSQNDTLTLELEFEALNAGTRNSNLLISSNDKFYSPLTIPLEATGYDPNSVEDNPNINLFEMFSDCQNGITKVTVYNEGLSIGNIDLKIYNNLGNSVLDLYSGSGFNGSKEFTFNNDIFANGLYYIVLRTANTVKSIPVIIVK
jgi:hypothetical protein